jgi:hypothetical protein
MSKLSFTISGPDAGVQQPTFPAAFRNFLYAFIMAVCGVLIASALIPTGP